MRRMLVVAALALGALVAGCGGGGTSPTTGSGGAPTSSTGVTGSGTATSSGGVTSPATPAPSGGTMKPTASADLTPVVVTGRVTQGVERGCLVLTVDGTGEVLQPIGDTAALPIDDVVTVQGVRRSDIATTCMQGRPFQILQILS